jgi:hypothetical protein
MTTGSPTSSPSLIPDKFVFMQCEDVTKNCCNGLDSICNLRVDEIFYASVHNAMASVEGGFLFQHNHQFQLEGAMEAGYRGINLDVCKCNGQYQLGICDHGARDPVETFASINSFLDEVRKNKQTNKQTNTIYYGYGLYFCPLVSYVWSTLFTHSLVSLSLSLIRWIRIQPKLSWLSWKSTMMRTRPSI